MTRYKAEIAAGSLMSTESRRIAALLLTHPDEATWQHAIEVLNILQKKTPSTARRQARHIKQRLATLDDTAWMMIAERESEVVIQLLLAASVKHSQLLADFMHRVYADCQRRLEPTLSRLDWQDFLTECAFNDIAVQSWSDTTRAKLFQVIVRILCEAKYLENHRSMKLTPPFIHPVVRSYFCSRDEKYILECLERSP